MTSKAASSLRFTITYGKLRPDVPRLELRRIGSKLPIIMASEDNLERLAHRLSTVILPSLATTRG